MGNLQDFMLLFRFEPLNEVPVEAALAEQKKCWGDWIDGIAARARLVHTCQLGFTGMQLHADGLTEEGIYIAGNRTLGGNLVLKADSMEDAIAFARGCPILSMGGTVEIRNIIPMQMS